jgi:type II secretory pathway component GspD/PulD (secretin)
MREESRRMKSVSNRLAAIAICTALLVLAGCSSAPSIKDDKELNSLVEALVKNSDEMKKKSAERVVKGIKTLKVETDKVSADLEKASVPEVVRRMFAESGRSFMLENVELHGKVSARFDKLPFLNALNLILKPILLTAQVGEDGIIGIRSATEPQTEEPSAKIYTEVPLRNIDTETAINLLNGLFGEGSAPPAAEGGGAASPGVGGDSAGTIKYGALPTSNTIFLRGEPKEIAKATQMLMKADSDVQHVVIEVLIVEYKSDALETIGTKLQELSDGKFGNVNVDFFTKDAASRISFSKFSEDAPINPIKFKGVINMLVSTNKARLISRPYISTLSGKEANIQITSDRYVIVNEANGVSATRSIQAGVMLKITPTILAGGNLRMSVDVEDSQFSDIVPDKVSTEVSKNAAKTVMQVEDGQTIMIGGMVMNRRSWGNSGFPWLRNIPGLKWVFAKEDEQANEKEVAIYVTPHIWKPEMISPLIQPDALTSKEEGKGAADYIKRLK